ncbi:MAG: glycine--tRNA ligase subunit beta, partial [Candidatus Sumerlaeota bacterium]|nr:glycine--tRNA ligase subunit beta [Candidatus Sumerlaeota bacterium]
LGSMLEKNERLERIAEALAEMMGLSAEEKAVVKRAGRLAKADLMSHMVIELTSLAGLMGREYARRGGEPPEVAEAIFECTLPRFAGDKFPASKPGIVLSLADRLDSLVGLFAVGLAPTSAADPFALRRAALGVVQTLVERGMELDLRRALQAAAEVQPVDVAPQVVQDALDFVERRMEQWLLERGERFDLVQAVLAARGHDPALAERTLRDLSEAAQTEAFTTALTAYSRPARIVRGQDIAGAVDPARFEQDEERALWAAWETAQGKVNPAMGVGEFLRAFEPLIAPINKFFDEVFVMVDDAAARNNRLALLRAIADLSKGIVDLTKVQGF